MFVYSIGFLILDEKWEYDQISGIAAHGRFF